MLADMARRSPGPVPDVFETFEHRIDHHDSAPHRVAGRSGSVGQVARSAGVTVGLMVLTALGFVAGSWLAAQVVPEVGWVNPLWEGLAFLLWCGVWGVLAAALVLSVALLAVGLPWVRRQRGARPTSTSTP